MVGTKIALPAAAALMLLSVAGCGDRANSDPQTADAGNPTAAAITPQAAVASAPDRTGDEKLAPELAGISSWINSEPFTLADQRGKVVLVDFWTYSCINCIRTFPFLKDWHDKYADRGLVIVGVHTPEFGFEKKRENVVAAARTHGLQYAIAQDNNDRTWDAFRNNFWPAKYLIDKDGYIRYTHLGEGAYAETEQKIRQLLVEAGGELADIPPNQQPEQLYDRRAVSCYPAEGMTRELFAGYTKNYSAAFSRGGSYILQPGYFKEPDAVIDLEDSSFAHHNGAIYIQGLWLTGLEKLVHARQTENYEDYLATVFYARSVNVVMGSESGVPYEVRVTIVDSTSIDLVDEKPVRTWILRPLKPSEAGADVRRDDEGNSYVLVDEPRLYSLVQLPEFGSNRELRISSNSADFSVFSYTFGAFSSTEDGIPGDYFPDCPSTPEFGFGN